MLAGPAAIFSWLIAAGMILMIGLCYAELGPMFPVSGGVIRFPHLVWGSFASYTLGFIMWISSAAVPAIEVEGALTYATKFAAFTEPHTVQGATVHTLTPLGLVVAVVLMALFVLLNWFGVRLFANINTILVWWKLLIIALVVIVFLVTAFATTNMGTMDNFTSHGFAPKGFPAVLTCISTAGITFSFLGFRQGIELAGETKNPKRNVPLAVIGSVVICAVIYAALQFAFTLAVPAKTLEHSGSWAKLAFENDFGPLAALSVMAGIGWLAWLLYIDAVVSPADTGFIYTTVASRMSYAMARNGNAPSVFARVNRHGVPVWSLILTFGVGLILLLPFPSWQQLVGFITSATVISFGSGPLVVAALRRQMPERERPFRLPGGHLFPILGFFCSTLIVYWGGWDTNYKLFLTIVLGFVLFGIFALFSDRSKLPRLDFKAGAVWVLPWLGGMALISWLMDPATHPDLFWWAFLANAVLCAIVYVLALKFHLPLAKVENYVREAEEEAAHEEEELAGGTTA